MFKFTCDICSSEFESNFPHAKYCSKACRNKNQKRHYHKNKHKYQQSAKKKEKWLPSSYDWIKEDFLYADLFLPESSGVYAVYSIDKAVGKKKRLLYIGSSNNLVNRWSSHHRTLDLIRNKANRIEYFVTEDYINLEKRLINKLNPPLNGTKPMV